MRIMKQTDFQSDFYEEGNHVGYDMWEHIERDIIEKGRQVMSFTPMSHEFIEDGSNNGRGYYVKAKYIVVHYLPLYAEAAI